jgi:hypothetical protein
MQSAKDTFYITLRDRLAALNPARTMVVRGVTRPGTLVEENELPSTSKPADAFCLRWQDLKVVAPGAMPLISMQCEIHYCTDGSTGNGGTDRGRLLAGMDAELMAAAGAAPQSAAKTNYTSTSGSTATNTRVFWSDVAFGPATTEAERLTRTATVEVFAYQEAGDI